MVFNNGSYNLGSELDDLGQNDRKTTVWTISKEENPDKAYSYDEAINLAGKGWYSIGLLFTLCVGLLAMALDMFGFSVVVTGCTCDLELDHNKESILLSMPFLGPIIMSYPWGYISDTKGRRLSLLIAMWCSFIVTTLSAFSPNWVVLAVLKFISTSFCSCAQSATFALLGESCPESVRQAYMLILNSALQIAMFLYMGTAYVTLNLDFSYSLGFLEFTPWRLLVIILALPLGLCATLLLFFYESPKFIVNAGNEEMAVEMLRKIWKRNGRKGICPINKLAITEIGNIKRKDTTLMESLWLQTAPLFRPPYLVRTLQLYLLIGIMYSSCNSLSMWFPFFAKAFFANDSVDGDHTLCGLITSQRNDTHDDSACITRPTVDFGVMVTSAIYGLVFAIINLIMSRLSSRRKSMMIFFFLLSTLAAVASMFSSQKIISLILFFAILLCSLNMGIGFSYTVDFFPTSYRGMAACLAVVVARASALASVNLIGTTIVTYCSATFYGLAAYFLLAAGVSCFLPSSK